MIAYVLITVEVGKVHAALDKLSASGEFSRVAMVAGVYDLVAILEAQEPQQIGNVVVNVIQPVEGVARTVTLLELTSTASPSGNS